MTDESAKGPSLVPAAAMALAAVVLLIVSIFGGGDFMLLASLLLGGISATRVWKVLQLRSQGPSQLMEGRMIELQDGLDSAQEKIEELRAAQDFDRELGLSAGEKPRATEDVS